MDTFFWCCKKKQLRMASLILASIQALSRMSHENSEENGVSERPGVLGEGRTVCACARNLRK